MIWREEKSILEARAALIPERRRAYKDLHKGTAEKKGKLREFMAAQTLTEMKRILWG